MSKNTGDTVLALLLGAAVGVGVGILIAPDKGSETRKKIKDKFQESGEDLVHKYEDMLSYLQTKASNAKSSIEDTFEQALSDGSYKTEEAISFLERKLAELKTQNAKLQK